MEAAGPKHPPQPNRNGRSFPRKMSKRIAIASERFSVARTNRKASEGFLKEEGRGTRIGYEASKGSKGISGL